MSCGVGHRGGWDLASLWLWRRPAAAAPIGPLSSELPYAMGVALKKQKTNKQKNKDKKRERERERNYGQVSSYTFQSGHHWNVYKISINNIWDRVWKKGYALTLLVGIKLVQSLWENNMKVPQKTKNKTTVWSSNSSPRYISEKKKKKSNSKSYMKPGVHSIVIYSSQVSLNRWMDKEWIIYIKWNITQP